MSTPCQEAPEAWVGNDDHLRAYAATQCRTKCPVYAQCLAGTFGTPGPEDSGVWAGVDYLNGKPVIPAHPCANPACGRNVTRPDAKFCSRDCYWTSMVKPGGSREKTCDVCGTKFTRGERGSKQWAAARYCSIRCSGAARRKVAA